MSRSGLELNNTIFCKDGIPAEDFNEVMKEQKRIYGTQIAFANPTVLDISWKEYIEHVFTIPNQMEYKVQNLRELPGIYAWMLGNKCVYVGKSVNVKRRVKEHIHNALYNEVGWHKYSYMQRKYQAMRNNIKRLRFVELDVILNAEMLDNGTIDELLKRMEKQYIAELHPDWNDFEAYQPSNGFNYRYAGNIITIHQMEEQLNGKF